MNIKDAYVHVGPSGTNEKALLKDFAITAAQITLTRAIQNDAGTGDKTENITVPIWNQDTTGNAATATLADKVKGSYTGNGGQQNPNYFGTNKVGFLMMNTTVNGNTQYKDWIIMDCYSGNDVGGGVAFGVNRQSLGAYIMRSASARTSWEQSAELLGTHNYNLYAVPLSGGTMTGALTVPSLSVTGAATFSQAINGSILGNAATASRLQNARTISLTGSVTGSGTFDGSGNLSIATTTNHTHNYAGSSSAGGAATNVVVNSGDDTNSTYPLVWHSGNTLYSTADIYCNPSTDFLYSKGLIVTSGSYISVGTPGGSGSGTAKSYISAGPGYSINAGRYGVKILTCDQTDCQSGLGQDLAIHSGWTNSYNFSIVGGNSSADKGYISFVTHKVNSTTYRYVGGFEDNAGTVTFQVEGSVHASSFVKANGTSAQFLKADGSVDSNTYLTSTTAVTNWTVKSDDANYPIAFSPNVTPSASNNAYNTGFTFNPGTKTFNNNGCRQQYDSTNKVLKFIFD